MQGLVFALLDTSAAIGDRSLAAKLRDLTISWSRFKYSGPILEDADLDALLARAAADGHRWCLVQEWGHVIQEIWTPERHGGDLLAGLERWAAGRDFLAAGSLRDDGHGLDSGFLLVDLDRWRELGRPAFDAPGRCGWAGLPVHGLPAPLLAATARLAPAGPAAAARLRQWLGTGIAGLDRDEAAALLGEGAARFLATVQLLTGNLRRGVFVWNVESYDDVREPPPGFAPPLATLYSVAAGLKPNWMLEALGFDERTRVVFLDYSAEGLQFRRLLLEEWDGEDYPAFLRRLFRRLPSSRAFYCLWDGATPETLDWDDVEARWHLETERWGGASILRSHWTRYRRLRHELVHCDLLADPGPLLATLCDEESAAIWWSNAFFSVNSNWHLEAAERRRIYRRWIEALAQRAPRLLLYGATSDNVSVNFVRAAEYLAWYRDHGGDELAPGRLAHVQMLY